MRAWMVLLTGLASLFWVGRPVAQNLGGYKAELRSLYRQGRRLTQRKRYKRAIIKFQTALGLLQRLKSQVQDRESQLSLLKSQSTFLYVLGRTYEYDRQWYKAFRRYRESLAARPSVKVQRLTQQRLGPLVNTYLVRVVMRVSPAHATVVLRDRSGQVHKGTGSLLAIIQAGRCSLQVTAPGYRSFRRLLTVVQGTTVRRRVVLRGQPVRISLQTQPTGARVVVLHENQQTYTGTTPWQQNLPPGRANVQVRLDGYASQSERVQLRPGQRVFRRWTLQRRAVLSGNVRPEPSQRRWGKVLGWTSVGVAAASLGAGVALFFVSQQEFSAYEEKRGNPNLNDEVLGHYDRGSAMYTTSIVAFCLTGVATVGAIGFLVWASRAKPTPPKPKAAAFSSALLLWTNRNKEFTP
ncbi:MAG: PEGA domain-containing protein [Deltaproteobacteria bacterium]|nr:MAG: PEGA domain-containing protein [Deltaproteobacteria bacterium]